MDKKLGGIFGEYVSIGNIKRKGNYLKENRMAGFRTYLIFFGLFLVVFIILLRLVFLQIVHGSYYRELSDSNRVKTIIVHAPRGIIFDRGSKPLVFNVPGYRQNVNGETKLISEENAIALIGRGGELEVDSLREYPLKEAASHVLGYLGQISEEELRSPFYEDYLPGEIIGKMGVEAKYEKLLKGVDGKQLVEVDSRGVVIRKLGETDPISGNNIKLTIDLKLQEASYKAMEKVEKGAVVVTTPKGEVLALISKPSFDANLFTKGESYKVSSESAYLTVEDILNDSDNQPLLNRAVSGSYPPGSTFKIVTAATGLEGGIIDENYTVEDTGVLKVGSFSFANWFFTDYGRTDGEVNVIKGIKRSNDIFFYKLAEKIGIDRLSHMAKKFYIDKALGIDLSGETAGTVPDNSWKKKVIGEPWYLGDTYHIGIGQGYLLATPLLVNSWSQTIASGGDLVRPYLFKDLGEKKLAKDLLSEKTVKLIRQGMVESCAPGGVAYPLFQFKVPAKGWSASGGKNKIDGKNFILEKASKSAEMIRIPVACKTGTAQHGGEKTKPHAWITLFAPAYDPEIVVTVLAEDSGEGSAVAAPIAKKILEEWFSEN